MKETIKKAFKISDGVASLAHKNLLSFVSDLEKEGALTKQEKQTITNRLTGLKKNVYDSVSQEIQRIVDSVDKKEVHHKKAHSKVKTTTVTIKRKRK